MSLVVFQKRIEEATQNYLDSVSKAGYVFAETIREAKAGLLGEPTDRCEENTEAPMRSRDTGW